MTICTYNHREVAYEGWDCPMCELIKKHDLLIYRLEVKAEAQIAEIKEDRDWYHDLLQAHNPELLL